MAPQRHLKVDREVENKTMSYRGGAVRRFIAKANKLPLL